MRAVFRGTGWNYSSLMLLIGLSWAPSAVSRSGPEMAGTMTASTSGGSSRALDAGAPGRLAPDDATAREFLEEWLHARGYAPPVFEVSAVGVPRGADAATFCTGNSCLIRIRPESLHAAIANSHTDGSAWRQWQNLLLHEAVHYIDIQQRGKSDHGSEFRKLARELGVIYRP